MPCWCCTFPNSIQVLFNHPYYIILDMPDKIVCVYRPHGEVGGCKPCIIEKMKKSFKLMAVKQGIKPEIKERWDDGHLHYIIVK